MRRTLFYSKSGKETGMFLPTLLAEATEKL
jgi:hypothetical protein